MGEFWGWITLHGGQEVMLRRSGSSRSHCDSAGREGDGLEGN